jgi:hypothetical protein
MRSDPILQDPDFSRKFIVQIDSSEMGLGAVLAQGEVDAEMPILFISRKLSDREQRYAIVEKEAIAIKDKLLLMQPLCQISKKLYSESTPCDNLSTVLSHQKQAIQILAKLWSQQKSEIAL